MASENTESETAFFGQYYHGPSRNRGQRQTLPQCLWRHLKETNKESWKFIYLLLQQDTNILRCALHRGTVEVLRRLAINNRKPVYRIITERRRQTHDLKNGKKYCQWETQVNSYKCVTYLSMTFSLELLKVLVCKNKSVYLDTIIWLQFSPYF